MEFEVWQNYTVEDFAAFWYGFYDKSPGKKPVSRISDRGMRLGGWLFLAAGGLLLAVCALNPLHFEPVPGAVIGMGLAFLALGVVTLVQWRPGDAPVHPRWAVRAWKKWSRQEPGLRWRYRLTPEGLELHNSSSDHRYDYSHLRPVWEDEGHFYLSLDGQVWHILSKSQFTQGDPTRFAAFLKEQTGRPVSWVNGEEARV